MVAVSGAGVFSGTRMEEDVEYVETHGMTSLENTRLHLVIIFISNFLTETYNICRQICHRNYCAKIYSWVLDPCHCGHYHQSWWILLVQALPQ